MPAVKTEDLATRLVDEAGRILSAEGAAALTLRRVAAATGTSTMTVYTRFGDKAGLLAAMYRTGFARLGAAMSAVDDDDPLTALGALGMTYREVALANPHLYGLMFGRTVAGFAPDEEDKAAAEATFRPLVDAVQRCADNGALVTDDAERVASYLWAVSHGMVSLELAGQLTGGEAAYRDALTLSVIPFLPRT